MSSIRGSLLAAALVFLTGGCGGEYITNRMGDVTFNRNNGEVTLTMPGDDITEGSGQQAEEKRPAVAFHGLAVDHGIEVMIEDGPAGELTVEADDNLLPLVETKVENGVLRVRLTGSLKTSNAIRVKAAASELTDVSAICSSTVTVPKAGGDRVRVNTHSGGRVTISELQGDEIDLSASSAGQVTAEHVDGKRLKVNVNSSGRVEAAGTVDEQDVVASSSGNYDGGKLASRVARVQANSAGTAAVHAKEEVTGAASSSGSVRYVGNPAKVSVDTSSAGSATAG
jgi:hypothetical protein